jgi:hypothetical protein
VPPRVTPCADVIYQPLQSYTSPPLSSRRSQPRRYLIHFTARSRSLVVPACPHPVSHHPSNVGDHVDVQRR